jgi:hypothetical protein
MNTTTEQTRPVTEAEMAIIRWAVTGLAIDVAKSGVCPEHLDAAEVEQLTQLLAHLDGHGSVFDPPLQCALVVRHHPRCYLLDEESDPPEDDHFTCDGFNCPTCSDDSGAGYDDDTAEIG